MVLLCIFAAVLASEAALLPVVKLATDYAAAHWPATRHKLKYKVRPGDSEPTYDMGRVARRMMMLTTLALLIAYRRRLNIGGLAMAGLDTRRGWGKELGVGAGLGVGSLAAFLGLMLALGAWRYAPKDAGFARTFVKALATAAAVGLLEEVLFRGFLLQCLAGDFGARAALVASSAFYSILHFFRASVPAPLGFDPWIGCKTLAAFFDPILREPAVLADPSRWNESITPATIGLFLVGMVLGFAFLRTRRLWMSIGLHAGWVFALKTKGAFLAYSARELAWLYGGKRVVTGVAGWAFLLALWAGLAWRLPRRGPDADSQD